MLAIALFSTDIIIHIWQLSAFLLQVHTVKCTLMDPCHKYLEIHKGKEKYYS